MNYYKFHIGDYLTRTMHLADAEDLAYRRLIDMYYITERPLPLDINVLVRHIRLDADVIEPVLSQFFEKTEDGYFNKRCDDEVKKYQKLIKHNQKIAKKSLAVRRSNSPKSRASKGSEQVLPPVEPTVEPSVLHPITQEPITNKKQKTSSAAPTRFDEFWAIWPASSRKVAKAVCQKRWSEKRLDQNADVILAHVKAMKQTKQWKEFEPAPLTYLNQCRWLDDVPAESAGGSLKDGVFAGRRVL